MAVVPEASNHEGLIANLFRKIVKERRSNLCYSLVEAAANRPTTHNRTLAAATQ